MKIVINDCYGGFYLPMDLWDIIDDELGDLISTRTDPRLIKFIEDTHNKPERETTDLKVVELPDNATDYRIYNYDGWEWITAVVDGKIIEIR